MHKFLGSFPSIKEKDRLEGRRGGGEIKEKGRGGKHKKYVVPFYDTDTFKLKNQRSRISSVLMKQR